VEARQEPRCIRAIVTKDGAGSLHDIDIDLSICSCTSYQDSDTNNTITGPPLYTIPRDLTDTESMRQQDQHEYVILHGKLWVALSSVARPSPVDTIHTFHTSSTPILNAFPINITALHQFVLSTKVME